jgi:hypothetical protein
MFAVRDCLGRSKHVLGTNSLGTFRLKQPLTALFTRLQLPYLRLPQSLIHWVMLGGMDRGSFSRIQFFPMFQQELS